MEGSPFLPLSEGLSIERVTASDHELLVSVSSSSPNACCPFPSYFSASLRGMLGWSVFPTDVLVLTS